MGVSLCLYTARQQRIPAGHSSVKNRPHEYHCIKDTDDGSASRLDGKTWCRKSADVSTSKQNMWAQFSPAKLLLCHVHTAHCKSPRKAWVRVAENKGRGRNREEGGRGIPTTNCPSAKEIRNYQKVIKAYITQQLGCMLKGEY